MKKVLALVMAILMLTGMMACANKNKVPDDYQLASVEDAVFDLYIPKSWQSNVATGLSGGYSAIGSGIMVDASTRQVGENADLEAFAASALESYREALSEFEQLSELEATTLGAMAAYRFEYAAKFDDDTIRFRTTFVFNKGTITTLLMSAPKEIFSDYTEVFDEIASYFSFRDFEAETEEPFILVDENTPDGFYLASHTKYEYRLYVPDTWTVDTKSMIPSATFSDVDVSNISLSTFTVNSGVPDGKSYWEQFKKNYGYELTEVTFNESAKLGKYDALEVEYITDISGLVFHVKQVYLSTPSLIYIFTYTSDTEHYDQHMEDVNTMISMFEFK